MSLQIKGLDKILANYDKRSKAITVEGIVNGGTAIVQGHIVDVTAVDTGALRASVSIEQAIGSETTATASVFTALEYAPHVEFGTVNMSAQPFMHKGTQLARSKVQKFATDQIKKAMKV